MDAVVPSNSGSDRLTSKSTFTCDPPLINSTLETLPTSTPEALTNWPDRSPLAEEKTAE
jgi:hypothetical protein